MDEKNNEKVSSKRSEVIIIGILSVVILGIGFYTKKYLEDNKIVAKKTEVESYLPTVDVVHIKEVDFAPIIRLQGEVTPGTETQLISEVSGAIVEISPNLKVGNVLEKGELIVRVDDSDLLTALANAESTLADAELTLAQEQARAEQSIRDWKKLGRGTEPSKLVRRIPQIKSAEARISATTASIEKAKRDIKKTTIKAPYRCVVDQKFIDTGAFLSPMSRVATVYSDSSFEVRLPVSLDKVDFLPKDNGVGSEVQLTTKIGVKNYQWRGVIDRFEGGIDTNTFSMIMVVQIHANTEQGLFSYPPRGLFVDVLINGKKLENVIKVPRLAVREGNQVWLLNKDDQLIIRDVKIIREEKNDIYIHNQFEPGSRIVTSPIAVPVEGMRVKLRVKKKAGELTTTNTPNNG